MQIVYGVNSGYLFPALVSIYSIWKHTSRPVCVTIYADGLTKVDTRKVHQARELLGQRVEITLREFDSAKFLEYSKFTNLNTGKAKSYLPSVALLPLVLPQLVEDRCLFIDADTVVLGDINQLMSIDLEGRPIGGCPDVVMTNQYPRLFDKRLTDVFRPERNREVREKLLNHYLTLGFVPTTDNFYFNAGIMIMDCEKIRKVYPDQEYSHIEGLRPFFDYFPEQDRLNQLFHTEAFQVPLKWNNSPYFEYNYNRLKIKDRRFSESVLKQINEANEDPKIWHFYGGTKPWIKKMVPPPYNQSCTPKKAFQDYDLLLRGFENLTGLAFTISSH